LILSISRRALVQRNLLNLTEGSMQISHIEVRRHPIWQREVHQERLVARPNGAISPGGRLVLAAFVGIVAIGVVLIVMA
jgi:hypothetical protein